MAAPALANLRQNPFCTNTNPPIKVAMPDDFRTPMVNLNPGQDNILDVTHGQVMQKELEYESCGHIEVKPFDLPLGDRKAAKKNPDLANNALRKIAASPEHFDAVNFSNAAVFTIQQLQDISGVSGLNTQNLTQYRNEIFQGIAKKAESYRSTGDLKRAFRYQRILDERKLIQQITSKEPPSGKQHTRFYTAGGNGGANSVSIAGLMEGVITVGAEILPGLPSVYSADNDSIQGWQSGTISLLPYTAPSSGEKGIVTSYETAAGRPPKFSEKEFKKSGPTGYQRLYGSSSIATPRQIIADWRNGVFR